MKHCVSLHGARRICKVWLGATYDYRGRNFCYITHLPDFVRNLDLNSRSAGFSSAKGLRVECPSQHQHLPRAGSPSIDDHTRCTAQDAARSHPIILEWPSTPTRPQRVQTMYDPLFVSRSICSLQGTGGLLELDRMLSSSSQDRPSSRRRAEFH